MALRYSPKIITDGLVMCLDPSQNKSYPTDLPVKNGLLVWLDAADDSTFSYSSGTEVSQWRDKSGNNFHANQATTANQPSRNTVVNSRKSVNFTSANGDRLRVNSGMVFTNSVTAIVFIKPGTQNFPYADILDQDHAMDGYNGWVIQRNNAASQWLVWLANQANTTWLNTNAVSYADNTPQIVTLRKGSSTLTLSSNGTSSGDVAIADEQIRQVGYLGLNIGSWRAGNELFSSSRHYNGEICEIVVYNRALSLTELKQVHTYLGQKWGISNTDRSIVDLSNNNNHGLLGGVAGSQVVADMPLFDVYNKGALKFDGSSDYLSVADNFVLNPVTVTVSMWLKRNAYQSSICNFLRRNDRDAYALMATNNTDTVWFRIRNSLAAVVDATTTMPLNTWTNLVGTFDGSNVRIYKDGVLANTNANTSPISYSGSTLGDLIIARDDIVSGRYAPINVGSTLIYSRALSATEVLRNYEAQKSKFANTIVQQGLVLNLDAGNIYSYAGAGTVWYDVSGNSYNGTLIGSPVYTSNNNGGIIFDSVAKYVTLPASGLAFGTGQFAIEAWVFSTAAVSYNHVYSSQSSNNVGFISLYYQNGYGFSVADLGNSAVRTATTHQTVVSQNTWYHVVGIRNASNQYIVYVNGVESTTNSTSSYPLTATAPQIASNPASNTERFTGTIASFRLYNTSLSAAQVLQNYNATKGRFGL